MTETREPYVIEPKRLVNCQHFFRYQVGRIAIRHCEECGKSWALMELESMVDVGTEKYSFRWREIQEEA